MRALICGSIAFDTIMVFKDHFNNHILPDRVHMLNVSFLVPEMRREFGGCAGNVVYNLRLLGTEGVPLGTVGDDFSPYQQWMERHGIDCSLIRSIDGCYTAQAYITSDLADNQITAFHPGAMAFSDCIHVPKEGGYQIAMVSADGLDGMINHMHELSEAGVSTIFDPGQAMTQFSREQLIECLERADYLTVNDYECAMFEKITGLERHELSQRVKALIVTRGGEGSVILQNGQADIDIPSAPISQAADPTGCGDAFRAGLIHGLLNDMDWETTGRIASLAGAIKVEHAGTQNHHFTAESFAERFRQSFGRDL